jgi:membrane-associated phospholipid phosphatase
MADLDIGTTPGQRTRRRGDSIALVAGLAVLGAGMIIVRNGTVPGWERDVFDAVNGLPDWLYRPTWPLQQLGVLVIGPIVALVAALTRHFRLALAALLATVAKLALEQVVKAMVTRERPGTSIGGDIETRGDVSVSGESFVSGHAVLAAALAGLVSPYLPGRWKIVPWVLVALVMFGRVYVGAHNPLDVVCGAALGLAIASCINLLLGVPAGEREPQSS